MTFFESSSRSTLLSEQDLFRKPVPTFRDHALSLARFRFARARRGAGRKAPNEAFGRAERGDAEKSSLLQMHALAQGIAPQQHRGQRRGEALDRGDLKPEPKVAHLDA